MHYQLKKLWANIHALGQDLGFYQGTDFNHQRALLNNNAWWNKMPMLEVLQVLGPGMRMGPMLAKDTLVAIPCAPVQCTKIKQCKEQDGKGRRNVLRRIHIPHNASLGLVASV